VLGLSITSARQQKYGKVPSQTSYAAFTGALGIIASVIGIVSLFVDRLRGVFTWVLDGVTSIALLAAGVVGTPMHLLAHGPYIDRSSGFLGGPQGCRLQ
jgi:hypothetical protein